MAGILLRGTGEVEPEDDSIRRAVPKPIVFSVRAKSAQLLGLLRKNGSMSLRELIGICKSRSEIVATFLSVLELCSSGQAQISGGPGDYEISGAEQSEEETDGND